MGYGIATRMGRSRTGTIISIFICFLIGIGIMTGLAAIFISDQEFKSNSIETEGEVIKIHKETRTRHTRRGRERRYEVFVATVAYNTLDGKSYKCRSTGDKDNPDYLVGQKTKVHYNKINPANSRLEEDEKNRSLAFLVGSAFGLFFIILPIITIIKRRPFNKTEWEKRHLPVN